MRYVIGFAVAVSSALVVYFLHSFLPGEVIPIASLFLSLIFVFLDFSRIYFYIIGMISYPLAISVSVVLYREQSLYPIVMFYELSVVAMVFFGAFIASKARSMVKR